MIYCDKAALLRYRGLHPALDRALEALATLDLEALPDGKTELDGDTVYLNRFGYEAGDKTDAPYETHLRYADIHLPLAGEETVAIANAVAQTETERDEAADYVGTRGQSECECALLPGKALIVFPGEAHRSGQARGGDPAVQKVVCKVRMA